MISKALCIACSAAAVIGTAAVAQTQAPRPGQAREHPHQQREMMMKHKMLLHHVDDIHGKNVTNNQLENLGSIETLIIDTQSKQVTYGVVSIGGFLGIGDTLIAVPWDAFELRPFYDGLVLNMTRSQLEAAPQFQRDEWPNFGDPAWAQEMHQHYGTTPRDAARPGARPGGVEDRPRPGQAQDPTRYPGVDPTEQMFLRTRTLIGSDVENAEGESAGTLNNLAMALHDGTIAFAVVGTGGFLGMGQENVAIPWDAFRVTMPEEDEYTIVVDVPQDRLERAPAYEVKGWPEERHVEWARDLFPATDRPGQRRGEAPGQRDRDPAPRGPGGSPR